MELYVWRVDRSDMTVEAVYSSVKKRNTEKGAREMFSYEELIPISFTVKGSGRRSIHTCLMLTRIE